MESVDVLKGSQELELPEAFFLYVCAIVQQYKDIWCVNSNGYRTLKQRVMFKCSISNVCLVKSFFPSEHP
jgi:hypothetical protein